MTVRCDVYTRALKVPAFLRTIKVDKDDKGIDIPFILPNPVIPLGAGAGGATLAWLVLHGTAVPIGPEIGLIAGAAYGSFRLFNGVDVEGRSIVRFVSDLAAYPFRRHYVVGGELRWRRPGRRVKVRSGGYFYHE